MSPCNEPAHPKHRLRILLPRTSRADIKSPPGPILHDHVEGKLETVCKGYGSLSFCTGLELSLVLDLLVGIETANLVSRQPTLPSDRGELPF